MKIAVVTQARIGSSRLPKKVIRKIGESTLLEIHLNRAKGAKIPTHFFVATTLEKDSNQIVDIAIKCKWEYYQGDLTDVLARFYNCLSSLHPDYVVRITSDCPLIDPVLIDDVIAFAIEKKLDYASNAMVQSFPDGLDVEIFRFSALETAYLTSTLASEHEHVTPYIWKNSTFFGGHKFTSGNIHSGGNYKDVRITVDNANDFKVVERLIAKLGTSEGWLKYTELYLSDPEIHNLNMSVTRNEGYQKSLKQDQIHE